VLRCLPCNSREYHLPRIIVIRQLFSNLRSQILIIFEEVSKTFDNGFQAVNKVSFQVSPGETLVLLGTSGCGKTTAMKMINRLIEPTSGQILINGKNIMDFDPIDLRRSIGYAVQHIGLFNHMTVSENIALVPKMLKWDQGKIESRIDELLTLVSLDPIEVKDRYPSELSGGQRQRIGVIRALAADPPIILMDEPFGALDPLTREAVQNEFNELKSSTELDSNIEKTVVFVTHDMFEAVKMADQIALMDQGSIVQIGTPRDLVENPANEFVEQFISGHKFQLSLMTKPIKDYVEPSDITPEQPVKVKLSTKHTIIEALDVYKNTNKSKLPVYKGKKFMGYLPIKSLYNVVIGVLEEMGEGE